MSQNIREFIERMGWSDFLNPIAETLSTTLFHNTIFDYLVAVVTLVVLVSVFAIIRQVAITQLRKLSEKTANDTDDMLVKALSVIGIPLLTLIAFYLATLSLELTASFNAVIRYILIVVLTLRAVQILQTISLYSVRKMYMRARPDDSGGENVIKNISLGVRFGLWCLAGIFILDNLGIDITALVAGLGIGGIAIAMASQAILGDALAAFSIFFDKPFVVGDFIVIDDFMGCVEHIGIKTTKIRSLGGEQLIFSNTDLTSSRVKNYKRMETRRIVFTIGVTYQTTSDQVKKIPKLITEIIGNIEGLKLDRVHFKSFGDFSLNFETAYYVQVRDYNIYMDKQQEINFAIKETLEKENIQFAYPTQSIYITRESNSPKAMS